MKRETPPRLRLEGLATMVTVESGADERGASSANAATAFIEDPLQSG
jgi:hypothetical protein